MTEETSPKFLEPLRQQTISEERKVLLDRVTEYILQNSRESRVSHLIFVCTHNSRRSQIAQFWAQVLAEHYGLSVAAYSGGTEVTALAPQAARAIEELGFDYVVDQKESPNPRYKFRLDSAKEDILLYSKLFTKITDSQSAFASLMCCAQAEESCPFVPGTELRVSLNYQDPKYADGTADEKAAYHKCIVLIGSEINYIFSEVKKRIS